MDLEETTTVEVTPDKANAESSLLDDPDDDVSGLDDLPEFILEDEENENLRSVEKPELEQDSPQTEETQNRSEDEDDDEYMPIMPIVEMEDDDSAEKHVVLDPLVGEESNDLTTTECFPSESCDAPSPSEEGEVTSPAEERRKDDEAEDSFRDNKNKSDSDEDLAAPVMSVEDERTSDKTVKPSMVSSDLVINGSGEEVQSPTEQLPQNAVDDEAAKDAKNMAEVVDVMSDLVMDVEAGNTIPSPKKKVGKPVVDEDDDVIALDSPENGATKAKRDDLSDDEQDMPMIRMKSDIFEAPNDDDDDDDDDDSDPVDIHSMMQVEMAEDSDDDTNSSSIQPKTQKKRRSFDDKLIEQNSRSLPEEAPSTRRTPRRAAAQAAANVIKEISNMENDDSSAASSSLDPAYRTSVIRRNSGSSSQPSSASGSGSQSKPGGSTSNNSSDGERNRCHQCKTMSQSLIVVRQYGMDIHLCSNVCFNSFRNPDPIFRPLPCAKCGTLNRDNENGKLYFWETMNFCSDLCVGNYQLQIGAACSTCTRKTPWTCMGKYCVRFGSDVRQFCTASCLESYKKSARVCFHCQLDIKRLGNVVLANIPSKAATKEFCSQECVEMYIDQNLRQGSTQPKTNMAACDNCKQTKAVFKELVTSSSSHKTCSQACWDQILRFQNIATATKCETCSKFINMDSISISPSYYVATEKRAHGFCSATCKNVYVLKSRQILSCTTCKVKKYNYDLIQFVTGRVTNYAVCSLNCLPKPSQYILNLKDTLNPSTSASQMTKNRRPMPPNQDVVPVITSCTTVPKAPTGNANQNKSRVPNGTSNTNGFNSSGPIVNGDAGFDYATAEVTDVTVRQMADDDIIEIRDDDDVIPIQESSDSSGQNQVVPEDVAPLDDERWLDCEQVVIIRPPPLVKRRNKGCMMTSVTETEDKESQTDSEELWAMPRVEMKLPEPEEKVRYVPVPIPYPVLMPYPCYAMSTPVPVPFPVGIAVPIPIPLDMSLFSKGGFTFNDTPLPIDAGAGPSCVPANDAEEVEMMDTSETCDVVPSSPSPYLNIFNFTNSPMSVGSPSAPTTAAGGTSSSIVAPGSPLGAKPRLSRADQGIRAWKIYYPDDKDPLNLPSAEFSEKLVNFVLRATKPKDRCRIEPDVLLNYVLGIQQYLKNGGRTDSIFYDSVYSPFVKAMTTYAEEEASRGRTIARVDEEHFWDSMELGAGSPGVLLFTLIYHIYKHFNLKTWQEHAALEFSQIQIDERTSESGETIKYISIAGLRNVEDELIEVPERSDCQLRCPVKLFEFYKIKCETKEGTLFKAIMQSNMPESSVWYTTESLNQFDLYHMLVRAMMIHFEYIE